MINITAKIEANKEWFAYTEQFPIGSDQIELRQGGPGPNQIRLRGSSSVVEITTGQIFSQVTVISGDPIKGVRAAGDVARASLWGRQSYALIGDGSSLEFGEEGKPSHLKVVHQRQVYIHEVN